MPTIIKTAKSAPGVTASAKGGIRGEAEGIDKNVAEGRVGARLEELSQVPRAAHGEPWPQRMEAVEAEVEQVATDTVVVEQAGRQR
jgi:hypothetical protein